MNPSVNHSAIKSGSVIDLHMHSYYSDGVMSPADLIALAHQRGVRTLALTDHDTINGIAEAMASAAQCNMTFIPGVEISTRFNRTEIHVVGLQIDPENTALCKALSEQQERRSQRAQLMGEKLAKDAKIPDVYMHAKALAGSEVVGRAHFARYLVQAGYAKDIRQVFKKYLVCGKPGYVPPNWPELAEVLSWIKEAGGYSVLAHPARYKLTRTQLRHLLATFKEYGGDGIEVVTSTHTPAEIQSMAGMAQQFGLYASMGSDFHGAEISGATLGSLVSLPACCMPIWQKWE